MNSPARSPSETDLPVRRFAKMQTTREKAKKIAKCRSHARLFLWAIDNLLSSILLRAGYPPMLPLLEYFFAFRFRAHVQAQVARSRFALHLNYQICFEETSEAEIGY